MWIGTLGKGLFLVPNGHAAAVHVPAALPDNSVVAILEDREQNIWAGTSDGLVRLSAPEVRLLDSREGLPDDNVSTVYCDPHGSVWLTTVTGEAFRYTAGRILPVRLPAPADRLRIRGTFEDRTGALWFGTDNQGAIRFANGSVSRFTVADGLRNNGMQGFFEDNDGNLWMGTSSGLSRWDGSHFTNYYLEQGLSYGWVRAFAKDHNGDMLVGTDRGINRFHDGKFVTDPAFAQLSRDRIWAILPESPDTLWIATRALDWSACGRAKSRGSPSGTGWSATRYSRSSGIGRPALDERSARAFFRDAERSEFRSRWQVGLHRRSRVRNRGWFGIEPDEWRCPAVRMSRGRW